MDNTRIKIILSVFGDKLNHDDFTKLIGINPTDFWNKGDLINGRNNKTRKETAWNYSTHFEETLFLNELLNNFFENFKNKMDIADYILEKDLKAKIFIVVEIIDDQKPALFFGRKSLRFISQIDAEIDIDMYLIHD